jgi:hypothetical protein
MPEVQKSIFLCVLFFAISTEVYSQKFTLGLRAGGSANWVAFGEKIQKDTFNSKPILGYSGGFLVGFPLKKNYEFLAEGTFSRKGRRLMFNKGTWENRSIFHFAEATMLLRKHYKFYLRKNIPSEWFFNLGPEVSYLLNASGKIIVDGNKPGYAYNVVFDREPDSNYHNMYYNNINRWLFGLVLGVGMKVPLKGNQRLATELRFISGHTYLGKRKSSYIEIPRFEDTMITNFKSINLFIAYSFDFDVQRSRKGKSTLDKTIRKKR